MSFVYPAGLWALLGVLALLAAHFIRRRYAQRTVPSAYLWRLSERFLMRMEPARRARRAILLALQVLCLVLCALLIAQPLVVMPGAQTAYVAVLDASGSMQITEPPMAGIRDSRIMTARLGAPVSSASSGPSSRKKVTP